MEELICKCCGQEFDDLYDDGSCEDCDLDFCDQLDEFLRGELWVG